MDSPRFDRSPTGSPALQGDESEPNDNNEELRHNWPWNEIQLRVWFEVEHTIFYDAIPEDTRFPQFYRLAAWIDNRVERRELVSSLMSRFIMAMNVPRIILVAFLLFFFFFSPNPRRSTPSQPYEFKHQIQVERHALHVLNTSVYSDLDVENQRWLNLTGLRRDDNYAWDLLPKVQNRAKEQLRSILEASTSVLRSRNASESPDALGHGQDSGQDLLQDVLSSMIPYKDPTPLYQNITGNVRGRWSRSKLEQGYGHRTLNLSALAPGYLYSSEIFKRNITGWSGDVRFKFDEKSSKELSTDSGLIRELKAEMIINDETSGGDGWELSLFGVHYLQQGGIVLSTTSEKFAGIFALPQFALSESAFSISRKLLNATIMSTIDKQESSFKGVFNPWTSSPGNPSESFFSTAYCEFIVYLQQYPMVDSPDVDFKEVEHELRFPTGAPLPSIPGLKMSALIFSPDCGFVLESKGPPDYAPQDGLHLNGQKLERYLSSARRWINALALVFGCQIYLLKRQMNETSTPSTTSRVSFYTIAMMAMGDGFACISLMVIGMFVDALKLQLTFAAYISFLCVGFFGMKFIMDIYNVQAPERQERERERQRARDWNSAASNRAHERSNAATTSTSPNPGSPVLTAAGADTLPLPATARRRPSDTPVILPPDQDLVATEAEDTTTTTAQPTPLNSARNEMGALYVKFFFLLLAILSLSLAATSWPVPLRNLYSNTLAFLYLSFWTPQIYRNIMRNCRKALRWEYVTGQSLLRLSPFLYFYTFPNNILYIKTDPHALYALAAWLWIQVWALLSQEFLGPRFFIKESWVPPAYDYHPLLRETSDDDAASTMPIGFTEALASPTSPLARTSFAGPSSTTGSHHHGQRRFDCAICHEVIDAPIVPAGDERDSAAATAITMFTRRSYMVTPCRHIFHSPCLEGWMRYRLQCPICRENLPAL